MLTINTSNPQAAYIGNDTLFKSAPPIDFAETNLGYVGSQNKFLLKIPQGQITIDAKRGQIFLISGNEATDLTAFGSGVNRFMTDHLAFEILRYFPGADTDNNFNGIGLHGVYDSKFDRIIITKLDYIPQPAYVGVIKYGNNPIYTLTYRKYYIGTQESPTIINLLNPTYFCNKSWTLSFNMNTRSWISFHSYIPNYYIAENNFFYSGLSEGCSLTFVAASSIVGNCTLAGIASLNNTTNCIFQGSAVVVPDPELYCTLEGVASFNVGGCIFNGNVISVPFTTTTTTTTAAPNCALAGIAAPIGYCQLVGTATGVVIPSTTTTTTTATPTTTTTTTVYVPVCTLAGVASVANNCALGGNAVTVIPTTTTTTTLPPTTTTTTTLEPTTTTTTTTLAPATTTTTTTSAPVEERSVTINPLNSLSGSSYTPYINGSADAAWDNGTRLYPVGTVIRIDYSSPACSVTMNGSAYSSASNITISSGTDYTFELKNADHYVNNGATYCSGNELRQPIINDCGNTSYNVVSSCSCDCNVACNGTYFGNNYCDGSAIKRAEYYFCNNAPTGYVETVIACSCDCNQACNGTYFTESCNGTTLIRTLRYVCNDQATGYTETTTCDVLCLASTNPEYTDQGYTACYQPSCTTGEVFKDTNSCSPTYNNYFIEVSGNKENVGGPPTAGSCNTTSNCQDTGSPYCDGPNWVVNRYQANPCSGEYCPSPRVIEYNSVTHGCYTPPSCESLRMTNDNGFGLTDYIEWTDCGGTVQYASVSDGSYQDICRLIGTPLVYSYCSPTYLGTCS